MKTTDLIPIILYQLTDGDRYGYEIIKQIEDKSNGGIIIKQPTLYSVLKKLEQGRFITSYWQDSEIGGKRHYYKLTPNGQAQLSTYPALEVLINDVLDGENSDTFVTPNDEEHKFDSESVVELKVDTKPLVKPSSFEPLGESTTVPAPINLAISQSEIAINDTTVQEPIIKPIKFEQINEGTTLYSVEVDVDEEKNVEISPSIFDALNTNTEDLATSNVVEATITPPEAENIEKEVKFIENTEHIAVQKTEDIKVYDKLSPNMEMTNTQTSVDHDISPISVVEEVKYLNYIDFKTDEATIKRRKAVTKHIQKMTCTCLTLLLTFILSLVICNRYSFSKLYYICAIIVCLILILYPMLLLVNLSKLRYKYCMRPFIYYPSRDFFVKLSISLILIILILAYNISIATTIKSIFELNNFASFIAPIVFSIVIILDWVYSLVLYKKYKNKP
ncbi:MAG: PadR family transcriptional regulator [Clostridia bacterium]